MVSNFKVMILFFHVNRVWGSNAEGQYAGDEAADWFSKYLNKPNCSLYQLSKARILPEEKNSHAIPDDRVGIVNRLITAIIMVIAI